MTVIEEAITPVDQRVLVFPVDNVRLKLPQYVVSAPRLKAGGAEETAIWMVSVAVPQLLVIVAQ